MSEELENLIKCTPEYVYKHLKTTKQYKEVRKLLQRNEPMNVKNKRFSGVTQVGICDNCSGKVVEANHNYCPLCGQKLDWSGSNE